MNDCADTTSSRWRGGGVEQLDQSGLGDDHSGPRQVAVHAMERRKLKPIRQSDGWGGGVTGQTVPAGILWISCLRNMPPGGAVHWRPGAFEASKWRCE